MVPSAEPRRLPRVLAAPPPLDLDSPHAPRPSERSLTPWTWLGVGLGLHALWALAFAAVLRAPRPVAWALWAAWAAVDLALPTLVPLGHTGSGLCRILLAIHCGVATFKACELLLNQRPPPGPLQTWAWLAWVRPYNHVYGRRGVGQPYPPRACARKLLVGALLLTVGVPCVIASFRADLGRYGFWVDHLTKFVAFYVALLGAERVLTGGWNLAGIPARPLLNDPAFATSPADFWKRWNHPVNQLFAAILFRRWARRAPLGALLLCFLASGILHEYIAAIASLHLRGYQLLFFLLHGLAAAATWRWRPKGAARAAGHVGTVAFGLVTSPLFFASLVPVFDDLGPMYPHGPLLPP